MAPPGSPNKSNILAKRFLANPEFEASYKEQMIELTGRLYESGAAADVLAKWVNVLKTQATDLVDSSTVEQEAGKIASLFTSQ